MVGLAPQSPFGTFQYRSGPIRIRHDISSYIRDADETHLQVFWRELESDEKGRLVGTNQPEPTRKELCRVSLPQFQSYRQRIQKKQGRVFVWDHLESDWMPLNQNPRPGMITMLDAKFGGYDPELGFPAQSFRPSHHVNAQ